MPGKSRQQQLSHAGYYHVMNRSHNREGIFRDDQDHDYFLQLLTRYHRRFAVRHFHYCLVSNHFHC
jgi:putative transposase